MSRIKVERKYYVTHSLFDVFQVRQDEIRQRTTKLLYKVQS